jgi:hypothetical protein
MKPLSAAMTSRLEQAQPLQETAKKFFGPNFGLVLRTCDHAAQESHGKGFPADCLARRDKMRAR